ncbi:MAG TPA: hypothetical protein VFQ24_18540 [Terriglobia bacterium]|nr:hypothetical protein [Terriglobia bacterium]
MCRAEAPTTPDLPAFVGPTFRSAGVFGNWGEDAGLKPGATITESRRREVPNDDYDMLVIGSGLAGRRAAIQA